MILCAVILIKFCRGNTTREVVIPGYRHSSCWELMITLGIPSERKEVEGVLDHHGHFLDRLEAFDHAYQCGQLSDTTLVSKREHKEYILFNEDLY